MTNDQNSSGVSPRLNHLGQPIGAALPDWRPVPRPARTAMAGRFCRLEPLNIARHAESLFAAFQADADGRLWTYMAHGPFPSYESFIDWMAKFCLGNDPLFFAIIDQASGRALGMASYLRIAPEMGVMEVGNIAYAPQLQKTAAATEAMYLMMRRAFDELRYRRYEWKCDSLNVNSLRAAERLGFCFEGVFRQAVVYKNRNRDTTWFSVIDREWPALDAAYRRWLSPDNFTPEGRQKKSLRESISNQFVKA